MILMGRSTASIILLGMVLVLTAILPRVPGLKDFANYGIGILFFTLFIIFLLIRMVISKIECLPKGEASTSDSVVQTLKIFQGVNNRACFWTLQVLPWVILTGVIWYIQMAFDPFISSQLLGYAVVLFVAQYLMQLIPDTLLAIWSRNILAVKPPVCPGNAKMTGDEIRVNGNSSKFISLEDNYLSFIHDFESLLNHPIQWFIGGALAILFWILPSSINGYLDYVLHPYSLLDRLELYSEFIAMIIICFVTGLTVWRMIVTGWQIKQLGNMFDLRPQLEHIDECGGLSPIGNLCLWNAGIFLIIEMYLVVWIVIFQYSGYLYHLPIKLVPISQFEFYQYLHNGIIQLLPVFNVLLPLPIILAFAGFFLPLWSTHKALTIKRDEVQHQLGLLSESIDHLESGLLDRVGMLEPDESEKIAKKLELMRLTYNIYQKYPVWPFNSAILKKLMVFEATGILSWIISSSLSAMRPLMPGK